MQETTIFISNTQSETLNAVDIELKGDCSQFAKQTDDAHRVSIEGKNTISFNGLVNMHDHLKRNVYPFFTQGKKFRNYIEWAMHLQNTFKREIDKGLKIPKEGALAIGIIKNVIAGFSIVSDHEKYTNNTKTIYNFREYSFIHSLKFHPHWRIKLLNPFKRRPVFVHLDEGTKGSLPHESKLIHDWNIFERSIIGIHLINTSSKTLRKFNGIIWCPDSNIKLYGETISKVKLIENIDKIMFGSDSTLSSDFNLWHHVSLMISYLGSPSLVFDILTKNPFRILNSRKSQLETDKNQIVLAESVGENFLNSFGQLDNSKILLVIQKGRILLADNKYRQMLNLDQFKRVKIDGRIKYITTDITNTIDRYNLWGLLHGQVKVD